MEPLVQIIIALILILSFLEYNEKSDTNIKEKFKYNTQSFLKLIYPRNPLYNNRPKINNIVPQDVIYKYTSFPPNPAYRQIEGTRVINDYQFLEGGPIETPFVLAKSAGTPRIPSRIY
jgi:hypothetical protein